MNRKIFGSVKDFLLLFVAVLSITLVMYLIITKAGLIPGKKITHAAPKNGISL